MEIIDIKRKRCVLILLIAMCIGVTISCDLPTEESPEIITIPDENLRAAIVSAIITIPDENLRAAIVSALGIGVDEDILAADTVSLTELRAGNEEIADLTGLEYFVKLETLVLDDNPDISDLTPLESLSELIYLSLMRNIEVYDQIDALKDAIANHPDRQTSEVLDVDFGP